MLGLNISKVNITTSFGVAGSLTMTKLHSVRILTRVLDSLVRNLTRESSTG